MPSIFSLSRKGQVMTAPNGEANSDFFLFSGPTESFNSVMVYNPGPNVVFVVATRIDPDTSDPEQWADAASMIIPAGEKAVYAKRDIDTGLSLFCEGTGDQDLYVYLGNGQ